MGLGQILRYLFTTLLARWAGVELLGLYSISNAVTRIMEVIGKLGLDQGILRKVSLEENEEEKQTSIRSALMMGLIFMAQSKKKVTSHLMQNLIIGWPCQH